MKTSNLKSLLHAVFLPLMNQRGEVGTGDGAGDKTKPGEVSVEVGGEKKTFTADDVKNLIDQQAGATQKTQAAAPIIKAAERYGVSVEDYLHNSEGSLALMNELVDKGIIDEHGTVLEKKVEPKPDEITPKIEEPKGTPTPPEGFEKKLDVILKARFDPMADQLGKLKDDNILLMKLRLQDQALAKFNNLDEGDVARVFSVAEKEPEKTFIEHAENYSKAKQENYAKLEEGWAKKHGVDLKKVEERELFEQDPAGGAAALFSGKKISFKRGKDSVSPFQATTELFDKLD